MKNLKRIANLIFVASFFSSACSSDDNPAINTEGEASLEINITVPPNISIEDVVVIGPNGYQERLNESTLLEELSPGSYKIKSKIAIVRRTPISVAYRPDQLEQIIQLENDQQSVNIDYQLMPGSGKIWFSNQNASAGRKIIGFGANKISGSGNESADVALTDAINSPEGLAFDPLGNLWAVDASGRVSRFNWDDLGSSNVAPSKNLSLEGTPFSLAFDADTTLWVTTFNTLFGFSKQAILGSQSSPSFEITSPAFNGLRGLAFDRNGDLWLANADANNVLKLSASKLRASGSVNPDLSLVCQSQPPVVSTLSAPTSLAFDATNNLWVGYFGPNTIARITTGQRSNSNTFQPVQFVVGAQVLIEHMAFDESGSLWLPFDEDFFAGISETGLNSGSVGVSIESNDSRYLTGVAVYPIPAGLPMK